MKPQEPLNDKAKIKPAAPAKKGSDCGCGTGAEATGVEDDADFAEGSNVKADKAKADADKLQKSPGYPRREAEVGEDDKLH